MLIVSALLFAAVAASPSNTELVVFSAEWCSHCRTMEPVLGRLQGEGYSVRRLDIDREPELAKRLNVTGVPCFVMLAGEREVDRVLGAASYDRLLRMYQAARPTPPLANSELATPIAAASFPAAQRSASVPASAPGVALAAVPAASNTASAGNRTMADLVRRALAATVRLRVEDGRGNSYGTGTVVHQHGDEALVLTCGHIFRDSAGKGNIHVDLTHPQAKAPVAGHLIGYDLDQDVALVSIRPGLAIEPIPVASPDVKARPGDRVFSIGCDRGDRPSVRHSEVTAVDKFLGPPNVVVRGAPVDGRSGGGLFSVEGCLIGVCNAADKADDEGLYAAAAAAYSQLDKANLAFIYRGPNSRPAGLATVSARGRIENQVNPARNSASQANGAVEMPPLTSVSVQGSPAALAKEAESKAGVNANAELICIMRPSDPRQTAQVIVVPQPSRALLDSLAREQGSTPGGDLTSLRTFAGNSPVPSTALGTPAPSQPVVVRGQSYK